MNPPAPIPRRTRRTATAADWTPQPGDWIHIAGRDGLWRIVRVIDGIVLLARSRSDHPALTVPCATTRATATTIIERRLGRNQRETLSALRTNGPWPGNGWTWSNNSTTRRIIQSLARRGLVEPCSHAPSRWQAVAPAPLATPPAQPGQDRRVYTRADLQDPTTRPPAARPGDTFRIAAPRRADLNCDADSVYRLVTPCCAKTTLVTQWAVDRMLDGRITGHFECGKAWHAGRGNSRRGGCRAVYHVRPIIDAGQQYPAVFELTWTDR
jgi:hypothetical protein